MGLARANIQQQHPLPVLSFYSVNACNYALPYLLKPSTFSVA